MSQETGHQRHGTPLVHRARRATQEAARDRELICWVARLRVVSSSELSVRFGVSEQRMNARVRRLLSAGLLGELCSMRGCRRLVYVSRKGAARVGLALRRPPQPGLGVARELALAGLLASLETLRQDLLVLTQREGRRVEAQTGQRLSVDPGVGPRWPDLVIASGGRLRAVELEFAAKPRKRQEEIFNAYAWSDTFDDIVWIVALPWVYDRLRVLAERADNTSVLRLDPNGVAGIARTLTGTWYRPAPAK